MLTFIACLRDKPDRRRRDLALLPGDVIAQAAAGGIVAPTRLNPVMVAAHFTGAPARSVRASRIVLAGLAVQGAIGYSRRP